MFCKHKLQFYLLKKKERGENEENWQNGRTTKDINSVEQKRHFQLYISNLKELRGFPAINLKFTLDRTRFQMTI